MRPFPLSLLGCLALLPLSGEEKPPAAPPIERSEVEIDDPKLKASIDACIAQGVAWLKARQDSTGAWPGLDPGPVYAGSTGTPYDYKPELTALALLALLKCAVPATDPCIVKGFAWLQKQEFSVSGGYGPAICLMALEAKHAPKEAVSKKGERKASKPKPIVLDGPDSKWAARLAGQLATTQSKVAGGWRYANIPTDMAGGKPGISDVSATQYALMGLKTARRMGIPVKPEIFHKAADFLLKQQETDGPAVARITKRSGTEASSEPDVKGYGDRARGWPYMKGAAEHGEDQPSGAMTCAGLVGMLICRSEVLEDAAMKKADKAKLLAGMEQSVFDGLAWLDAHWSTTSNPPQGTRELGYYLYGLERVGIMADLRMIGPKHDWYLEGARFLTERITIDKDDPKKGYWAIGVTRPKAETQETPYALLFLRKAAVKIGYSMGESD